MNLAIQNNTLENIAGPGSAFLSSVTWAIGLTVYTALSKKYPAASINFSRAVVALPLFILAIFISSDTTLGSLNLDHFFWLSISIIASYAVADVLLLKSVSIIGLPAALSIASTYPLWSALVAFLYKGETLSTDKITGLILVVAGTALVIISGNKNKAMPSYEYMPISHGSGYLFAIATSMLWALNTYSVSMGGRHISPFVANSVRMGMALILCPVFGLLMNKKLSFLIRFSDLKKAWPIFALEGFGGSFLFMYGITHAPLAVASALSSLSPIISVPIALILGWEKVDSRKIFGILIAGVGIWLLVGFASSLFSV